jgi:hypothetical protein
MTSEKMSYECAVQIQEDIQFHAGTLEVIISLLRSSDESYHVDHFEFKLGVLIESWLDELTKILERAVNKTKKQLDQGNTTNLKEAEVSEKTRRAAAV